jgi:hypothetical protein
MLNLICSKMPVCKKLDFRHNVLLHENISGLWNLKLEEKSEITKVVLCIMWKPTDFFCYSVVPVAPNCPIGVTFGFHISTAITELIAKVQCDRHAQNVLEGLIPFKHFVPIYKTKRCHTSEYRSNLTATITSFLPVCLFVCLFVFVIQVLCCHYVSSEIHYYFYDHHYSYYCY